METWDPPFAYAALFTVSLLASTLLPLGSEWLLIALLAQGFRPLPLVIVATTGNTLGASTTYVVGRFGGEALAKRWLCIQPKDLQRGQRLYTRYGQWTLLFSWVPVIGDPLCAISGFFRMPGFRFTTLVVLGKLARYLAIAWLTLRVLSYPVSSFLGLPQNLWVCMFAGNCQSGLLAVGLREIAA